MSRHDALVLNICMPIFLTSPMWLLILVERLILS